MQHFLKELKQPLVLARFLGNFGNLAGYYIVLQVDPILGSIVKIISLGLCIPFCVKIKLWDVIILFSFFIAIDIHNIFKLMDWV